MRLKARTLSLTSFLAAVPLYFVAFALTVSAISGAHRTSNPSAFAGMWRAGRITSVVAFVMFVISVAAAFLVKPSRTQRTRMWWVIPATVSAIAVALFDFRLIGF